MKRIYRKLRELITPTKTFLIVVEPSFGILMLDFFDKDFNPIFNPEKEQYVCFCENKSQISDRSEEIINRILCQKYLFGAHYKFETKFYDPETFITKRDLHRHIVAVTTQMALEVSESNKF